MMDAVYEALRRVDRSVVVSRWQELCQYDDFLKQLSMNLRDALPDAVIYQLDLPPDISSSLAPELVTPLLEFADETGSAGLSLRLLRLLPHAIAEPLEAQPGVKEQAQLRGHVLVNKCMIAVASRGLQSLDKAAHRDTLTGLLNKRAYERDLRECEAGSTRPVTVVFADVDGLKSVNDTQGHDAGDALIRRFADALAETAEQCRGVSVYRYAGDEHVVLAIGVERESVERLMREVRERFESFSYGIAEAHDQDFDGDALTRQADTAMYEEKQRRKAAKAQDAVPTDMEDG